MPDSRALLDELATWVTLETPTTDAAAVNRLMDMAEAGLREAAPGITGVTITRIPGRDGYGDNMVATIPGSGNGKPVLMIGHLDTVWSTGTLEAMPFRVEGAKAHGPGIYDMKAGSFLAFDAMRAVLRTGKRPPRPITLLLTPDEEVGSPSSRALIEAEARKAECVLILEPAGPGGVCVTARKGVGRFVMEVTGVGSHAGGSFTEGASAVMELARQIGRIHGMVDVAGGVTLNVAPIWGGTRPNVIPEAAGCEIDLRVPTAEAGDHMEAAMLALEAFDARCAVRVTGGMNRPPMVEGAGSLAMLEKAQAAAAKAGFELGKQHRGGGSDGNFTAAIGVPTLDGLGCPGAGAHASHEHILWEALGPRAAMLAELLVTL